MERMWNIPQTWQEILPLPQQALFIPL